MRRKIRWLNYAWNLAVKSLMGGAERGQPTSINPTLIDRLAQWEKDRDRALLKTREEQKPQAQNLPRLSDTSPARPTLAFAYH